MQSLFSWLLSSLVLLEMRRVPLWHRNDLPWLSGVTFAQGHQDSHVMNALLVMMSCSSCSFSRIQLRSNIQRCLINSSTIVVFHGLPHKCLLLQLCSTFSSLSFVKFYNIDAGFHHCSCLMKPLAWNSTEWAWWAWHHYKDSCYERAPCNDVMLIMLIQ